MVAVNPVEEARVRTDDEAKMFVLKILVAVTPVVEALVMFA